MNLKNQSPVQPQPPSLPVPNLEQTIQRYLERIEPLVSQEQYDEAKTIADNFATGSAPGLHASLEKYASDIAGNWLSDIWLDSYLESRSELNSNINYLTIFDSELIPQRESFSQFLAGIVSAFMKVYLKVLDGSLAVESNRFGVLCMEQHRKVFSACRIPQLERDELYLSDKTAADATIAVLFRNNIYIMTVTDSEGEIYSISSISKKLETILERSDSKDINVGVMTTAQRDEAAGIYCHLCNLDDSNIESFAAIHSAVFALCIDECVQRDTNQAILDMLHGKGENRWFDKCCQIIVGSDYSVGFNNEHSGYDAAIWMSVLKNVYNDLAGNLKDSEPIKDISVRHLDWVIDQKAQKVLQKMKEDDAARRKLLSMRTLVFEDFGVRYIKELGVSPDGFFHLALQLASYRVHGRLKSTYEAVSMRHFRQGRTECMRPATSSVSRFIKALEDGCNRQELQNLARAAMERHIEMITECKSGEAPERHLTGLMSMASRDSVVLSAEEDILGCAASQILKNDIFSTSGIYAEGLKLFAFAPVVQDGYGVGYVVDSESIRACIGCFQEKSDSHDKLVEEFKNAFYELQELLSE